MTTREDSNNLENILVLHRSFGENVFFVIPKVKENRLELLVYGFAAASGLEIADSDRMQQQ